VKYTLKTYKEIFIAFFKLGLFAFGGPAAHVAMMQSEFVEKRAWVTQQRFLDMMGFTNLIPGPNSTEMAILLGRDRGGVKGLFLAGLSFIFPAFVITLIFAIIYVRYNTVPEVAAVFNGIKPVILVIIIQALLKLSKVVMTKFEFIVLFAVILILSLLGISEIPLLLFAAASIYIYKTVIASKNMHRVFDPITLIGLFLIFLKIGAVLYGSGYVLLSFLNTEFVVNLGLITPTELLDAVAVGQFTPGPVFTTATFIGYLILGFGGAVVATIGIFITSFLVILLLYRWIEKMRDSSTLSIILDGVNAASLAFMASVSIRLGMTTLTTIPYVIIFTVSGILLIKYKVNPTYLIISGALAGFLISIF
jgi:chromate transporter